MSCNVRLVPTGSVEKSMTISARSPGHSGIDGCITGAGSKPSVRRDLRERQRHVQSQVVAAAVRRVEDPEAVLAIGDLEERDRPSVHEIDVTENLILVVLELERAVVLEATCPAGSAGCRTCRAGD